MVGPIVDIPDSLINLVIRAQVRAEKNKLRCRLNGPMSEVTTIKVTMIEHTMQTR